MRHRTSNATVRAAVSAVALALIAAGVLSNGRVSGELLARLGNQVYWFGVAAVAMCSFAGALCLSRWSSLPTRWLGLTLGFAAVYMMRVLATYEGSDAWGRWATLLLPSVPFAIAAWAQTGLVVARQTPSDARRSGFLARVLRTWRSLESIELRSGSRKVSLVELAIWLPCLCFAAAILIPGAVYGDGHLPDESWRGWTLETKPMYVAMGVWALSIVGGAALVLQAVWWHRTQGLLPGVLLRASAAPRAAGATMIVTAVLLIGATLGAWPEPVINAIGGMFIVAYAIRALDAEAYREAGRAFSSVRRRTLVSAAWAAFAFGVAMIAGNGPVASGALAAVIGIVLPLAPAALEAIHGVPLDLGRAEPRRVNPQDFGSALLAEQLGPSVSQDELLRSRDALGTMSGASLRRLVSIIPSTGDGDHAAGREHDPRSDDLLVRFTREFAPLSEATFEESAQRLTRMLFDEAAARLRSASGGRPPERRPYDPPDAWVAAVHCARRLPDPEEPSQREAWRLEQLRFRVWLRQVPRQDEPGGRYDEFKDIERLTEAEIGQILLEIRGRKRTERVRNIRNAAVDREFENIRREWIRRIERALVTKARN